jgi:hypothetical protein
VSSDAKAILFGPGKKILVRIDGPLPEYKGLAEQAGIGPEHERNWIVCSPVDNNNRFYPLSADSPIECLRRPSVADEL